MKPALFRSLTFLGTSSGCPTLYRNVSSYCLTLTSGDVWMIDAGEGTQHQLQRCKDVSVGRVSKIFVTHLHGDHSFGLPGLMASISLMWRPVAESAPAAAAGGGGKKTPPPSAESSPAAVAAPDVDLDDEGDFDSETFVPKPFSATSHYFEIYGPPRLGEFLRSALGCSDTHFMYQYRVHEMVPHGAAIPDVAALKLHPNEAPPVFVPADERGVFSVLNDPISGVTVEAVELTHRVFCLGYVVREPTSPGALDMDAVAARGVPKGPLLSQLKAGNDVTFVGKDGVEVTVRAADCVSAPRPGRVAVLLGDTCNSDNVRRAVTDGAAYVVHEATFDESNSALAVPRGHSTPKMAGLFATEIGAKTLLLTHFSARFASRTKDPESMLRMENEARAVFAGEVIAVDDFTTIDMSRKKV